MARKDDQRRKAMFANMGKGKKRTHKNKHRIVISTKHMSKAGRGVIRNHKFRSKANANSFLKSYEPRGKEGIVVGVNQVPYRKGTSLRETAAQRRNRKMDEIFDDARRIEKERVAKGEKINVNLTDPIVEDKVVTKPHDSPMVYKWKNDPSEDLVTILKSSEGGFIVKHRSDSPYSLAGGETFKSEEDAMAYARKYMKESGYQWHGGKAMPILFMRKDKNREDVITGAKDPSGSGELFFSINGVTMSPAESKKWFKAKGYSKRQMYKAVDWVAFQPIGEKLTVNRDLLRSKNKPTRAYYSYEDVGYGVVLKKGDSDKTVLLQGEDGSDFLKKVEGAEKKKLWDVAEDYISEYF
jgi:hypothetical protein